MKKYTIIIMSLFMIILFSSGAYALTADTSTGGATVTLTSSSSSRADLTFTPSPSTVMSAVTSATAYTVIGASSKTTTSTGIEYSLISGSAVVYQKVQATTNDVTDVTSGTAGSTLTGFAARGGTGS
ncbi:MAG: hypothetical protein HOJ48_06135 [Desulfobacula sp.]|jgi:hypothetical protein|nr:hypothetical protein [Desulfobacula sp.]MBT7260869.1 hypothetical protein [Desulfobacula sp.]